MRVEMDAGEFGQLPETLGQAGLEAKDALARKPAIHRRWI